MFVDQPLSLPRSTNWSIPHRHNIETENITLYWRFQTMFSFLKHLTSYNCSIPCLPCLHISHVSHASMSPCLQVSMSPMSPCLLVSNVINISHVSMSANIWSQFWALTSPHYLLSPPGPQGINCLQHPPPLHHWNNTEYCSQMNWTTGKEVWLTPETLWIFKACEYVGAPTWMPEYVRHPFYQGVYAIVITLLWGVALEGEQLWGIATLVIYPSRAL